MAVWIVFFGAMTALGATDGRHRGDTLPFWQQACQDDRRHACARLVQLEATYCGDNAGWACNELGRHYMEGKIVAADPERALTLFSRACEARFQPGCVNLLDPAADLQANPRRPRPQAAAARGRPEPHRDARTATLRPGLRPRLGVRVRQNRARPSTRTGRET